MMKYQPLYLLLLVLVYGKSIGQKIETRNVTGGNVLLKILSVDKDDHLITVYDESLKYDEIRLDQYTNGNVFAQYKIGYFNKENTKFHFGNFEGVYEYDIQSKKVTKLLPMATDSPNAIYRIIDILANNNTLVLLKGELAERKEIVEYKNIEIDDHQGHGTGYYATIFTHVYLNLDTYEMEEMTYRIGMFEDINQSPLRLNYLREL
ncbi:MAG: hypothetical protein ABJE80_22865 [Reichenbachiella sp.]|uniref:hypothetical protein n=1 Tax=Reichenbachiella sp. TaxID=2184521 RepID=UPI003266A621